MPFSLQLHFRPHSPGFSIKTSGDDNIALGNSAGLRLTIGNFTIDVDNLVLAGESSTIRIGDNQHIRTFITGIRGVTTGNANAKPVPIVSLGQLGTTSSSRRFKDGIKPMENASEAILALEPVTFQYKNDKTNTPQYGVDCGAGSRNKSRFGRAR